LSENVTVINTSGTNPIPVTGLAHALLDGSVDSDTVAGTVVRGDLIVGNSTPKWARFGIGTVGKFLRTNGTDPSWQLLGTGDLPAGTAVLLSFDVTQHSHTVTLADTDVATIALAANTFTDVRCVVTGFVQINTTGKAQAVSLKIKDTATQKGITQQVNCGDVPATTFINIPFTMIAVWVEQSAVTIHITESSASVDAATTVFVNSIEVFGIV
jgi:hypothetical protein